MRLQPERCAGLLALPVVLLLMAAACGVIGGDRSRDSAGDGSGIRETRATPTPDLRATIAAAVQQTLAQTRTASAPTDTPTLPTPSLPPAPTVDLQATIAAAIARYSPTPPPPSAPTYTATAQPQAPGQPAPTPPLLENCQESSWLTYADPDAAANIRALPWVADGVAGTECAAVRELGYLANYPAVFQVMVSRPWVVDSIDQLEGVVIDRIEDIAGYDAALAEQVANLSWLADGVTQPEPSIIDSLFSIAYHDVELAWRLINADWFQDDITQTEEAAVLSLYFIAGGDAELAGQILLVYLADSDMALAKQLAGQPWVADGVDKVELQVIDTIAAIADDHPALAGQIINLPWLSDGISPVEASAIANLYYIAYEDAPLAAQVASLPWFADGITAAENSVVDNLGYLADEDTALTGRIIAMPFLATLEPADVVAIESLSDLAYFDAPVFRQVMSHPTLRGGITDDWAGVVAVLAGVGEVNPALIDVLLNPQRVSVERRRIDLPLAGSVDLAVIRTAPGARRSIDLLEHSVRSAEGFMGAPLPVGYVALLFENAVDGYSAGTNFGTHVAVRPEYDVNDGGEDAQFAGHLIAHEVAHYYWRNGVDWVDEGAADFMASISENARTGRAVAVTNPPCAHTDSIAELERLNPNAYADAFDCNYALGERFFLALYRSIGDADFRRGFRNLYLMAQVEDDADDYAGTAVGIGHIKEAFRGNAGAVSEAIARWYD